METYQEMAVMQAMNILEYEMRAVDAASHEWALFGSSSLFVRGIITREPNDIDVMVSRRVWGEALAHRARWDWRTPNAGDPPILDTSLMGKRIDLFFFWRDDHVHIDIQEELKTAEDVQWEGIRLRCTRVENVIAHKEGALTWPREQWEANDLLWKMENHRSDIEACRRYLQERA